MSVNFTFALALINLTSVRAGRVLLALYALKLGAQPLAVGMLAATFSALPMLLSWQAGRIADRFGSRWPLLLGAAGGACGMLVPYFVPGLPALYVAAAMNGLSFAFYGVSLQNLVGLMSTAKTRAQNFSTYSLMISITGFLGPLLSGFSIDHSGYAVACLLLAFVALVPIAMLAIWGGMLPSGSRQATPVGGVKDMLLGSGLWRVLATSSLMVTGIDLFQFYMPIYGHDIGLSASMIGIVLAMFSAAAFVVRLIMPRLLGRLGEDKVLAYSFCAGAASLALIPFFHNAIVLSLLAFAFGLGTGCGQPITMVLTFSNSAEGRSGEVLGLRVTVNHLTRVVSPIVFGSLGTAFGLLPVFWLNALMLTSGAVVARPGSKSRRS